VTAGIWWTALWWAFAPTPQEADDGPRVEIVRSRGVLDGPNRGVLAAPRWDRVHLELELRNSLPVDVGDFLLRVELLRADAPAQPIPGWSFDVRLGDVWVPARGRERITVDRPLPDRREPLPAEQVQHRVELVAYRMSPARLEVGLQLLRSSAAADQRAALDSFDRERLSPRDVMQAVRQLASTLDTLPRRASAQDALRLLYVLRALGELGTSKPIQTLLSLEDRLPPRAWGPAVVDLAGRMVDASSSDDPRLSVLPSWARKRSELLRVRAQDAVPEAVRDAVVQMGDAAVPGLVRALHTGTSERIRERAWQLLVSMGRATVRAQLRIAPEARIKMVHTFGEIGLPDAAPALVELLAQPGATRRAAARALVRIGPPALEPLETALANPSAQAAEAVLTALIQRHPRAATRRFDARAARDPSGFVRRRARQRRQARRQALRQRVETALTLPFFEAERKLDSVYRQDPEIYRTYREEIAELYVRGARDLLGAGNLDLAVEAALNGLAVKEVPELRQIGAIAQLRLARGWGDLARWDAMARALDSGLLDPPPPRLEAQVARARDRLAVGRARQALASRERARARAIVDRRRRESAEAPELVALHRRLLLLENLPLAVGALLAAAAGVLAGALWVWRQVQQRRMQVLQARLDR